MEAQKKYIRFALSALIITIPVVSTFCLPPARSSEIVRREFSHSCIFCDIVAHRREAVIIDEDEDFIIFKDISPKAAIHYLIVPKKHIKNLSSVEPLDKALPGRMISKAQELSLEHKIPDYRIMINNGPGAGQTIGHLHMHFLAGKKR